MTYVTASLKNNSDRNIEHDKELIPVKTGTSSFLNYPLVTNINTRMPGVPLKSIVKPVLIKSLPAFVTF